MDLHTCSWIGGIVKVVILGLVTDHKLTCKFQVQCVASSVLSSKGTFSTHFTNVGDKFSLAMWGPSLGQHLFRCSCHLHNQYVCCDLIACKIIIMSLPVPDLNGCHYSIRN